MASTRNSISPFRSALDLSGSIFLESYLFIKRYTVDEMPSRRSSSAIAATRGSADRAKRPAADPAASDSPSRHAGRGMAHVRRSPGARRPSLTPLRIDESRRARFVSRFDCGLSAKPGAEPNLQKACFGTLHPRYSPTLMLAPLPALLNAGTVVVFRFSKAVRVAARSAWSLAKFSRWATVGS